MEAGEIVTLITNVGFPIACCVVLFVQNNKMQKTLSEMTLSLQKLSDKIDCHNKEVK
mgnify:CR=1 FL=1